MKKLTVLLIFLLSSIHIHATEVKVAAPVSNWTDPKKPSIVYATLDLSQKSTQKDFG